MWTWTVKKTQTTGILFREMKRKRWIRDTALLSIRLDHVRFLTHLFFHLCCNIFIFYELFSSLSVPVLWHLVLLQGPLIPREYQWKLICPFLVTTPGLWPHTSTPSHLSNYKFALIIALRRNLMLLPSFSFYSSLVKTSWLKKGDLPSAQSLKSENVCYNVSC